jgi:hypothetical protein
MAMATTPQGGSPFQQRMRAQQAMAHAGAGTVPMQAQSVAALSDQQRDMASGMRTSEHAAMQRAGSLMADQAQGPGEAARSTAERAQQLNAAYREQILRQTGDYGNLAALGQMLRERGLG